MKRSMKGIEIDADTISNILLLNSDEQLKQVTLDLHAIFGSFCTCIIKIDHPTQQAQTLSFAQDNELIDNICYPLRHTPCERVARNVQDYCLYSEYTYREFPNDHYLSANNIECYLGVPLRGPTGDVLGILVSTFTEALEDTEVLVKYHKVLGNIAKQVLLQQWLGERSHQLVNRLSFEAAHDPLTTLSNRSCLADTLESLTQPNGQDFSLIYVDIDNFKAINDTYSSYIGDRVLIFMAEMLKSCVTNSALAFRIAGDEFAVITFAHDPFEICSQIIDKLEDGLREKKVNVKFTVSMGIAKAHSKRLSSDELMLNASIALKDCKQHSGVRMQCYDTHLSAMYHRKGQLIEALSEQVGVANCEESELYVALQPIVNLSEGRWNYFEVLARWTSEEYGIVSPVEFIHVAEESGIIVELGKRIIELACRSKQLMEKQLGYPIRLSLNCSVHELTNSPNYLQHLVDQIQQHGFTPEEFTIELTETVLLGHREQGQYVLNELRRLGFKVALDDFGTGYSSLNYIHSYPIDSIKIDASFIRNMLTNTTSERVVWLIIQLAEQLGVGVVAEGVEDTEALTTLNNMGCHLIQGYYFSKPLPPQEMLKLIQEVPVRRA